MLWNKQRILRALATITDQPTRELPFIQILTKFSNEVADNQDDLYEAFYKHYKKDLDGIYADCSAPIPATTALKQLFRGKPDEESLEKVMKQLFLTPDEEFLPQLLACCQAIENLAHNQPANRIQTHYSNAQQEFDKCNITLLFHDPRRYLSPWECFLNHIIRSTLPTKRSACYYVERIEVARLQHILYWIFEHIAQDKQPDALNEFFKMSVADTNHYVQSLKTIYDYIGLEQFTVFLAPETKQILTLDDVYWLKKCADIISQFDQNHHDIKRWLLQTLDLTLRAAPIIMRDGGALNPIKSENELWRALSGTAAEHVDVEKTLVAILAKLSHFAILGPNDPADKSTYDNALPLLHRLGIGKKWKDREKNPATITLEGQTRLFTYSQRLLALREVFLTLKTDHDTRDHDELYGTLLPLLLESDLQQLDDVEKLKQLHNYWYQIKHLSTLMNIPKPNNLLRYTAQSGASYSTTYSLLGQLIANQEGPTPIPRKIIECTLALAAKEDIDNALTIVICKQSDEAKLEDIERIMTRLETICRIPSSLDFETALAQLIKQGLLTSECVANLFHSQLNDDAITCYIASGCPAHAAELLLFIVKKAHPLELNQVKAICSWPNDIRKSVYELLTLLAKRETKLLQSKRINVIDLVIKAGAESEIITRLHHDITALEPGTSDSQGDVIDDDTFMDLLSPTPHGIVRPVLRRKIQDIDTVNNLLAETENGPRRVCELLLRVQIPIATLELFTAIHEPTNNTDWLVKEIIDTVCYHSAAEPVGQSATTTAASELAVTPNSAALANFLWAANDEAAPRTRPASRSPAVFQPAAVLIPITPPPSPSPT